MNPLPPLFALGCLVAVGTVIALSTTGNERREPVPPVPVAGLTDAEEGALDPGSILAPAGPEGPLKKLNTANRELLLSFLAKKDARDLTRLYNMAVKLGASKLPAITDPRIAYEELCEGVPGKGELVFRFRRLSDRDADAALRHISHDGSQMVCSPEAEYSEEERQEWDRISTCQNGLCADCLDPQWRTRLRQQLSAQLSAVENES